MVNKPVRIGGKHIDITVSSEKRRRRMHVESDLPF